MSDKYNKVFILFFAISFFYLKKKDKNKNKYINIKINNNHKNIK